MAAKAKRSGSRKAPGAKAGTLSVGGKTTGYSPKARKKVAFKIERIKKMPNGRKMAQGKAADGSKVSRFF